MKKQLLVIFALVGSVLVGEALAADYNHSITLKNVLPGTYTVNTRVLREYGKAISGRAIDVVVGEFATATAGIALDVARPFAIVVTAYPTEVTAYYEGSGVKPATVRVRAQLLGYSGQPVGSGHMVTFTASAGTMPLEPIKTDKNGIATAIYVADTLIPGDVVITATYVDPDTLVVISNSTTIRIL